MAADTQGEPQPSEATGTEREAGRDRRPVGTFSWRPVMVGACVLVAIGLIVALLVALVRGATSTEVTLALTVIFGVAVLMTLLFAIASGFNVMHLTDPNQALGLPVGSVRAMIALILIMVFVIFGVYLYGQTNTPGRETAVTGLTLAQASQYTRPVRLVPEGNDRYTLYIAADPPTDAVRLAQQLVSTIGTLVVAVASFYFGSSTATSAAAKGAAAVTGATQARPDSAAVPPAPPASAEAGAVPPPSSPASPGAAPAAAPPAASGASDR